MGLITIFTAPKAFTNPHIATIQRNALQSWLHLGPEVEVLLYGREAGIAEVASEFGVKHIPDVACTETGAPYINSMFDITRQISDSPLLCVVNADIIFMPDIIKASKQLLNLTDRFLALGQRWDLDVKEQLDFSDNWVERFSLRTKNNGQLHLPLGSDYFIFPRGCFQEIPEFAIGRSGWDNWMIYYAMQQKYPTVDISPTVMIVHQNHDYSHLPGNQPPYHMEESNRNRELAGGKSHLYLILDMKQQLVNGQIRRPPISLARAFRYIELRLYPDKGNPRGWRRLLIRRLRRMRREIEPV